jgi:hypothetical protein
MLSRMKAKLDAGRSLLYCCARYVDIYKALEDCDRLIICWKELAEELPGEYETMLIRSFKDAHDGRRPFANRNK